MFNFNLKTGIWNYSIFSNWYNTFSANVSDFNSISLQKIENNELSYLHKKLSYASIF